MDTYVNIKLDMIRVYFKHRIANCSSEDTYDNKLKCYLFQLLCEGRPTAVHISREFIDEHSPADILTTLMRLRPESYIKGMNTGRIIITNAGVKVESSIR